jgi:hypothetical protein
MNNPIDKSPENPSRYNSSKVLVVEDKYRTNPLSLSPGGSTIEVHKKSGKIMVYDKIKSPERYLREIYPKINGESDPIERIVVENQPVFNRTDKFDFYRLID